jgi:hypothetical protein
LPGLSRQATYGFFDVLAGFFHFLHVQPARSDPAVPDSRERHSSDIEGTAIGSGAGGREDSSLALAALPALPAPNGENAVATLRRLAEAYGLSAVAATLGYCSRRERSGMKVVPAREESASSCF